MRANFLGAFGFWTMGLLGHSIPPSPAKCPEDTNDAALEEGPVSHPVTAMCWVECAHTVSTL